MKKLFAALLLLAGTLAYAQRPAQVVVSSPVVNPDNTVTFNYRNDRAKDVKVNVQFAGTHNMTKGENGIWSITLGPAAPDIYPYSFIVDGISLMDPQNPEWFPNETFKNSLLDIRGNGEPLVHAYKNVPHGSVAYVNYWSETLGIFANAVVYTPPFYDVNKDRKYPVMYLISGTTDTEEVYFKVGRVNAILDNLIAEGAAKEMIVVLPYGNPSKVSAKASEAFAKRIDPFSADMVNDLMPYIEKNYRTINDREHRAIGGFSRGGNQGLSIGLTNLDKFSYLCSYSSFTSMALPGGIYDDAAKLNKDIKLFWLGVGTDDFLYGNAKEYMEFLDSKGINNVKYFTTDKYGHTWMNAKHFLDKSLRLLFQEEINVVSMDIPAEPKKEQQKEEQRLTPAVMARLFPAGVVSPEYNADGSVTFRFRAPDAEVVELDCQMLKGRAAMVKDEKGVWSATVKPEVPDIYPYAFVVDGTMVADPNNVLIFANENFKYSLADVRGPETAIQEVQQVPHGKVTYRYYHSNNCGGIERPMCVYTPAGYDPNGPEKLPVLYLIHGMTDTYETWFKVGHVNNILDNLIAKGLAKRMIIAMPYANPYPEMIRQGLAEVYDPIGTDIVTREILDEVIPFIESNYNVKTDAKSRAIAGFSLGGRQTLACGLKNPDKFKYVCAMAPAIFGEEYKTNFENGTYLPVKKLKKSLDLFWLGTGSEDFLIEQSLGLDKYLTEKGMKHTFYNPGGGHTWMNCRDYIELVAKEIFR